MSLLERYKKRSEQFLQRSERTNQWKQGFAIGQNPSPLDREYDKLSTFKRERIFPLWKQVRSQVTDGKTLWQRFPYATEDEPPLFHEIKPFLSKRKQ